MKKECINCGEEYEAQAERAKYCSGRCKIAFWRKSTAQANAAMIDRAVPRARPTKAPPPSKITRLFGPSSYFDPAGANSEPEGGWAGVDTSEWGEQDDFNKNHIVILGEDAQ